jgi:hypothetical protein
MAGDAGKCVCLVRRYLGCDRLAGESGIKAEVPAVMRTWHDLIESSVANPFLLYIQNLSVRMDIECIFHVIFKEEVYNA